MLRKQGMRAALLAAFCSVGQAAALEVREGDIIFHPSRSTQSLAIQQATHSRYSHMGLVLYRDGQPQVYEASAWVKYTPLAEWIARGEGGHYVLKRLREADRLLDESALRRLRAEAAPFAGRRYDLTFEWSDQRLYCSELVWKIYQRALGLEIGGLQQIRDFDLNSAAVRSKMRERYGDQVPLDEQVISPAAMFDSPLLVQVYAQ
ncbi:YiiX family permuted papain-like enzyme [Aquipseudomonas guryensis]|jgi:hypothetical protein|uniref:YiiX family permuted papain-like enzyme n=1 Tax=Aquipseudomonas guryensis TaxID=2759165 RepID=A0A7W4D8J5_9GAMM|nr:YiiX family permuted papain-like enzyme [Pseudomonas guryensis]MBB1517953.1 YiiX family permuted papain-like enzyme [Pseudomonas guryensis]